MLKELTLIRDMSQSPETDLILFEMILSTLKRKIEETEFF